jgi:mitogen-activated protein kinase kinase 3
MKKEDFEYQQVLGRGVAAQVKQAVFKPLNKKVAIKSINVYDRDKRHQLMKDITVLAYGKNGEEEKEKQHHCPFLVELYGAYYAEGSVKVVLELMDMGSLRDLIKVLARMEAEKRPLIAEPVLAFLTMQVRCEFLCEDA